MKNYMTAIVRSRKDVDDLISLMETRGYKIDTIKGKEEFIYDDNCPYHKERRQEWTLSFSSIS